MSHQAVSSGTSFYKAAEHIINNDLIQFIEELPYELCEFLNLLYKLVRVSTPAGGNTVGTSNISTRNINVNISNIATSNPIRPTNSQQQQPMVNNNNSSNNITSPTAATTVKKLLLYSFLIKTELIEAYWTKNNATEMLMEKYE